MGVAENEVAELWAVHLHQLNAAFELQSLRGGDLTDGPPGKDGVAVEWAPLPIVCLLARPQGPAVAFDCMLKGGELIARDAGFLRSGDAEVRLCFRKLFVELVSRLRPKRAYIDRGYAQATHVA